MTMTYTGSIFVGDEVAFLRAKCAEYQRVLDQITSMPCPQATVLEVRDKTCIIALGGNLMAVVRPTHFELKPAMRVDVDPKTNGIIKVVKDPFITGSITTVSSVIDDRHCEVALNPLQTFAVLYHGDPPRAGDRVQLDTSNSIVIRNLGQPKAASGPGIDTGVSWDDIGGLVEAKRDLISAIESPVTDKALHKKYGKKRTRGALMCGPSGCGKTLLCRAAATSLAKTYGRASTSSGYQYVKGPELLHGLVGASEAGVRKLFANARNHFREHAYPAIIVLDEADSLLSRRGATRFEGMERTIVPMFLAEMDGLEESGAMVMVLTNRPDMLDPAIVRDGRLDMRILVTRPSETDCVEIVGKHLSGRPLEGQSLLEACEEAATALFADRHSLYMVRTKSGKDRRFGLSELVSGAMCAGLVERATELAMRREKESGKDTGITAQDLQSAADRTCSEQRMLDHTADLAEFLESVKDDVRSVEKVKSP